MAYLIKCDTTGYYVVSIGEKSYMRTKEKDKAHHYTDFSVAQSECDRINKETLFSRFFIEQQ